MTISAIDYQFCARTDPGRVRANNEDAVSIDPQAQIAVLADGMGGYNAGEVASGMATTFIQTEMARWLAQAGQQLKAQDLRRAIEICVDNANQAILGAAEANPQYMGMGTTLVVGVFQGSRLMLGLLPPARWCAGADHTRPFMAAGANRCRADHCAAGCAVVQP